MQAKLPPVGAWTDVLTSRLSVTSAVTKSDAEDYTYLRGRWALAASAVKRDVFGGQAPFVGVDPMAEQIIADKLSQPVALERASQLLASDTELKGLGDSSLDILSNWITTNVLDPIRGYLGNALWSSLQSAYGVVETFEPSRVAKLRASSAFGPAVLAARRLYVLALCELVLWLEGNGGLGYFRRSDAQGLGAWQVYVGIALAAILLLLAVGYVVQGFFTDPNVSAVLTEKQKLRDECRALDAAGGTPAHLKSACAKAFEPENPADMLGQPNWSLVAMGLGAVVLGVMFLPQLIGRVGAARDVLEERRAQRLTE
jgi:hypothetical protein